MIEKILPQEQVEKSEHRESSRFRNQPRKNYKILSHNLKYSRKLNFKNNFDFEISNFYTRKSF